MKHQRWRVVFACLATLCLVYFITIPSATSHFGMLDKFYASLSTSRSLRLVETKSMSNIQLLDAAAPGWYGKMRMLNVTASMAKDSYFKPVANFTIDPLVPFFPDEIIRTNPDGSRYENWLAMNFPPGSFWDERYKTPCFTNATDGKFRCFPHIYLVGWPKCGTSQLWWFMTRHQQLIHAGVKETHFLTTYSAQMDLKSMRELNRVLLKFDPRSQLQQESHPEKLMFDASTTTIYNNWNWRIRQGYAGDPHVPTHTNFHYLRKIHPKAQIIAMMRSPAKMVLSFYNHAIMSNIINQIKFFSLAVQPASAIDIHNFFVESIFYFDECVKNKSLRACCHSSGWATQNWGNPQHFALLRYGIYYIYLEEVYKNFPPSQVHLMRSEDFFKQQESELVDLFKFLGISTQQAAKLVTQRKGQISNQNGKYIKPLPHTYKLLQDFYKPFNKRLAEMLGDQRWLKWDEEMEKFLSGQSKIHADSFDEYLYF